MFECVYIMVCLADGRSIKIMTDLEKKSSLAIRLLQTEEKEADGNDKFYRLTFKCKRCIILVDRKNIKDVTMSQAQGQTDADDFIA